MKRRWRKSHLSQQPAEVNITAFMNLMVILVPFLLITAVFSRITILDMSLPAAGEPGAAKNEPPPLQLEVIVRKEGVEVGDRERGLLRQIPVAEDGSDLDAVSEMLQQIKARHPDETAVTLLLEEDVPYERLVTMMDTLRIVQVEEEDGSVTFAELFPAISIGDAPPGKMRTSKRSGS